MVYTIRKRMLLFDAHIHVGQFKVQYESPKELVEYLSSVGVSRFAVSSTTTCEENYAKVIKEHQKLKVLAGDSVIPVLWLTIDSLHNGGVNSFLKSGIDWKCVKIHPALSPKRWSIDTENMDMAIAIAKDLQVPFLIHTGETLGCNPLNFEKSIKKHHDVPFILAHGRPIGQTIEMMKKYPNVWCDTAFMPTENIVNLCKENLQERVLWGSDYPIPKYYYPQEDMKAYYLGLVQQLRNTVDNEDFERITHKNFERLFG